MLIGHDDASSADSLAKRRGRACDLSIKGLRQGNTEADEGKWSGLESSSTVGRLERDVHAGRRSGVVVLNRHVGILDEEASRPEVDKERHTEEDRKRVEQIKEGL